jgi:hypothetical protein
MGFLNWPVPFFSQSSLRSTGRRKRLAEDLLGLFSRTFPDINYEMFWDVPILNAQAWRLGTKRYVRLYGGLIRSPLVTKAGLALTIAHETGHHLGGAPCDPDLPWITWQGQADYWAARTAMPLLFGESARYLTLRGAREISKLHSTMVSQFEEDEPDLSPESRYSIFEAGALGRNMPTCGEVAFAEISGDNCTFKW